MKKEEDSIMKILLVKTVPGEIVLKKVTYNYQEIGIAKAFIKKGHQCDIMCCSDKEAATHTITFEDGKTITLYCMKSLKILKNGFLYDVASIFDKYDLLHVSEYNQLFTWHMAKKYKDKMVVWHGPYYSEFNKRYNLMCKVFDAFFKNRYCKYNTQFLTKSILATDFLKQKGIKNVDTIGIGIDFEALTDIENSHLDFVDEINQYGGKKLLYIGRLEPRRNSLFLIDVLKKCIDANEDISLVVIGRGDKGYVDGFFEYADKLGVSNHIIYRESVEQKYMSQLYGITDIFLLPTFYDIFGMVLLEAMYFSKVVITTKNGGSCMLINNGDNGFVIEEFSVEKWYNKIHYLLSDPVGMEIIGSKAHEKIVAEYTWDVLTDKMLDAYRRKLNCV